MQRLGFIIYHSAALCRDWASLYIILPLYAETGLHYISFCLSVHRLGFLNISFCRSMQRLGFIIYHSAALCSDWASLYIILSLFAETGLHYISFYRSMPRLEFIIYHSSALCRYWTSLYIILSLRA